MSLDIMGNNIVFLFQTPRREAALVLCDLGEMPHRKACALLSTPPQNGYILLWSQVYITLQLTNTYTVT